MKLWDAGTEASRETGDALWLWLRLAYTYMCVFKERLASIGNGAVVMIMSPQS